MKIAQVSPMYESVPPKLYGGTERVVSYLTEELVRQGHDVTLFASGDSKTQANLVSTVPQALRLGDKLDPSIFNVIQLQQVIEMAHEFDIIHFHTDYFHFPSTTLGGWPSVTTLHGRLDIKGLDILYRHFTEIPLVSISYSQRRPLAHAGWVGNVYHGLPENLYKQGSGSGGYAAFLGRISPEKRVDRAIEIARRAGLKLRVAAKIDPADREYYEREIKHLMDQPHVEFIGEIGEDQKGDFLGNAVVTLFPIDWPEPFGMVMIESLACGTPVIAYDHGSVSEVLSHGETGFIVNSMEEAVDAVQNIHKLNRTHCRETFLKRFSVKRMVQDYLSIYASTVEQFRKIRLPVNAGMRSDAVSSSILSA
ncbi:MAG: glycosyltransferase family 4 protein [Cyclobacteriaceae bacterium]|nr:glycosyltransferase family 4 protein [Cyclobacteriaceae bacterium]